MFSWGGYKKKYIIYGVFVEFVFLKIDWLGIIEKCIVLYSLYYFSKDKKLNYILLYMCVN